MYCSKCGKELKEGQQFCPECGNKVSCDTVDTSKAVAQHSDIVMNKKVLLGLILAVSGLAMVLAFVVLVGVLGKKESNKIKSNSTHVVHEEESPSKVQCMACNGTGKVKCSSCLGSGTEEILGTANESNDWLGERRACRAGCGGTGKVNCEYCKGTGWR